MTPARSMPGKSFWLLQKDESQVSREKDRSLIIFFPPLELPLRLGRKIESSTPIYFQLLCAAKVAGRAKKGRLKNGTSTDGNSYFLCSRESNCRSTAQMLPAGQKVSGAGVTPAHR